MEEFDYGIIGGGPAGYTAGMMLAKKGHSVVIFEKDKLGGTCLNRGCIPTKSFLHLSETYNQILNAETNGISVENVTLDFTKVVEKKNSVVEKIRKSLELTVKNSGAKTIYAEALIKDNNTILADNSEYKCKRIIVASGSKPREIKGLEFDGNFILSSDDILNLSELPKSILIVGSGAIGTEWARILSNFGTEVTIVEMAEHLIPLADTEVSKRIERIFKQRKIKFYLNNSIKKIEDKKVILQNDEELYPEKILVAVGREGVGVNIKDLGRNTGLVYGEKDDSIVVLGDASREIQLAHYAVSQAKEFALNIPFDKKLIPSIIYGEPEIAWVGLREQDIDETYHKHTLPITALGKSWCDDATDGFIKLITKDGLISGGHIVSKEASSLIHIVLTAIQNKLSIDKLKEISFAHPTYAEGIGEILLQI